VLGDGSDFCREIIALNGVIAKMHYVDIGDVALKEWLHGADGQIDRMNDADSFFLIVQFLISS
jgi:hypothetical protein